MSYKYNDSGIRTEKTVNSVETKYYLEGTKVIYEKTGSDLTYYSYDEAGCLIGLNYNGTQYFYIKNVQGDIIGILDNNLQQVVSYVYDSWGMPISIKDGNGNDVSGNASHIANINPYRYRGYRYDAETGLYYLQSRYYNPQWGRFLNADAYGGEIGKLLSHNIYVYCINNPINKYDPSGLKPGDLFTSMDAAARDAALYMGTMSFDNGWEYATSIYKTTIPTGIRWEWRIMWSGIIPIPYKQPIMVTTTYYTYKTVKTDKEETHVVPPKAPLFKRIEAVVHTHTTAANFGLTEFSNYRRDWRYTYG